LRQDGLLKTLIRLVVPTRGSVHFDGQDLSELSEKELTRQRIRCGYVFQNAALFDSMTIGQNVSFPLRQHTNLGDREILERVRSRLAEVGLPDSVMVKKPAELSGGMRKRVGLARALIMEPELILYDEPTTGLDPIMSDVINELMMRTRRNYAVTSIIVSHDMRTVRRVADRVVMIVPLSPVAAGRAAGDFRRSAERVGALCGSPCGAVRAGRGGRTVDGVAQQRRNRSLTSGDPSAGLERREGW
jgi:phospholipid/cholesterol/gamma-HCH transport system ATP-binding protein